MGGRRGRGPGTVQQITYSPQQGPDRVFVKFTKTIFTQLATGAAGAYAGSTLKVNSAFDPAGSLGSGPGVGAAAFLGVAPALYGAYIVHSWRIDVQFIASSAFAGIGFYCRGNSLVAPTSIAQMSGLPRAIVKLGPTSGYPVHFSMFRTAAQITGQSAETVAIDDTFGASYNADPATEIICDIGVEEPTHTAVAQFTVLIRLTQYTECFGRVTQS